MGLVAGGGGGIIFAMQPWHNWYHGMGNTYGTWPPGDGRGFRTRHHREHIEGDYKNPPPAGKYEEWLKRSRGRMGRAPVVLSMEQRRVACFEMVAKLLELKVEGVEACVTPVHFHVLARFSPWVEGSGGGGVQSPGIAMPGLCAGNMLRDGRDPLPRHCIGVAKKHVSHVLRARGLGVEGGGVWAVRSTVKPVTDRGHQLRVVEYLREHKEEGGVVWSEIKGFGS